MTPKHQSVIDTLNDWQETAHANEKKFLKHFFNESQPLCLATVSFSCATVTVRFYVKGGHAHERYIDIAPFLEWFEEITQKERKKK